MELVELLRLVTHQDDDGLFADGYVAATYMPYRQPEKALALWSSLILGAGAVVEETESGSGMVRLRVTVGGVRMSVVFERSAVASVLDRGAIA